MSEVVPIAVAGAAAIVAGRVLQRDRRPVPVVGQAASFTGRAAGPTAASAAPLAGAVAAVAGTAVIGAGGVMRGIGAAIDRASSIRRDAPPPTP